MSVKFVDRQPTYPNRYKITKADGSTEYITLERADEPTMVGTPLNAVTFNEMLKQHTPRNLLDNSDFRNPVNQRGKTVYDTVGGTIDRWSKGYARPVLTINDGYINIKNTSSEYQYYFNQRVDKGALKVGNRYTVAVQYRGGRIYSDVIEMPSTGRNFKVDANSNVEFAIGYDTDQYEVFSIFLRYSASIDVEWIALYEGEYTSDILPVYQPKGYMVELLASQRELTVLTSDQYGDTLPDPGVPGRIFFKKVT